MIGDPQFDNAGLGAVLKTALDAVVVMNPHGIVVGWNDVAEQSFGWTARQALGQRMSEIIIPPRHREAHERGLAHFLATGEGPVLDRHFEIEALHRDGHEIPVELSITRTEQFGAPVFLGFLRDITERREAKRRQELLIGELDHRNRNVLAVVGALASQTARNVAGLEEFLTVFSGRLTALGQAHEILTAGASEDSSLTRLAETLLAGHLAGDHAQVAISGKDILVAPRQLISIGMILHELITNSVKYGAFRGQPGFVHLHFSALPETIVIEWTESGQTGIASPERRGFGSRMIDLNVLHELNGVLEREWHDGGMKLRVQFPVARRNAA